MLTPTIFDAIAVGAMASVPWCCIVLAGSYRDGRGTPACLRTRFGWQLIIGGLLSFALQRYFGLAAVIVMWAFIVLMNVLTLLSERHDARRRQAGVAYWHSAGIFTGIAARREREAQAERRAAQPD